MKTLKERITEFGTMVKLAGGREKGEMKDLLGEVVTINNAEVVEMNSDTFVAFTIEEDENKFYFGGKVLSNDLITLLNEGYGDDIRKEGIKITFNEEKSKNNRTYVKVTYL